MCFRNLYITLYFLKLDKIDQLLAILKSLFCELFLKQIWSKSMFCFIYTNVQIHEKNSYMLIIYWTILFFLIIIQHVRIKMIVCARTCVCVCTYTCVWYLITIYLWKQILKPPCDSHKIWHATSRVNFMSNMFTYIACTLKTIYFLERCWPAHKCSTWKIGQIGRIALQPKRRKRN